MCFSEIPLLIVCATERYPYVALKGSTWVCVSLKGKACVLPRDTSCDRSNINKSNPRSKKCNRNGNPRYLKQAIVDKNALVSSSALVSGILLYKISPEVK